MYPIVSAPERSPSQHKENNMTSNFPSSVVLHSGGLDSTIALYQALEGNTPADVISLGIKYGAINEDKEMRAAADITSALGVERVILSTDPTLFRGAGSMLMGEQPMAKEEYVKWMEHKERGDETIGPSKTVVPFRNANLISMAVALAMTRDFDTVVAAMHKTDHENWAYPDCRPEFVEGMQQAIKIGTMDKVVLKAPFLDLQKSDVVKLGAILTIPFSMTWSCYLAGDKHCGECPTCLERKRSFIEAEVSDLTEYMK